MVYLSCSGLPSSPLLLQEKNLLPHDRIVFQHTHGPGISRARKLVEEAGHGHRDEAHRDHASLGFLRHLGQDGVGGTE